MFDFFKRRKKAAHKIDAACWASAVFAMERGDRNPLERLLNKLPSGPEGKELTPEVLAGLRGEDVVLIVGHGVVGSEPVTDFLLKDGRIFVTRDDYDSVHDKTEIQDLEAGAKLGIDPDIRTMKDNTAWVKFLVEAGGTVWIRRELCHRTPVKELLEAYRIARYEDAIRATAKTSPEAVDPQVDQERGLSHRKSPRIALPFGGLFLELRRCGRIPGFVTRINAPVPQKRAQHR